MDNNLEKIKKQYDLIGWGLLIILIGILSFIPGNQWNNFFIGLGAIILLKNLVLYGFYKISPEWFMVIIGAIVLIIGLVNELTQIGLLKQLPIFAIIIIVVGVILLFQGIFSKKT